MDRRTTENLISALSKERFDLVADLVIFRVFGLNPYNVDGPYDGGSDRRLYDNGGSSPTVAFQLTTQKDWQEKIISDATDAKKNLERRDILRSYHITATVQCE